MLSTRVLGHLEENRSYLLALTAPAARELLFVSTYDAQDPKSNAPDKHGYQRPPTPSRFPEIARYYLENGNRSLITPIVVSVRLSEPTDIGRFVKLLAAGDVSGIHRAFGQKVASIVDGQHRFYGLLKATEQDPEFLPFIPLMVYFGLSFVEEAELFNTINVTQRKLPKALIETTRGDITEAGDTSYSQQIRRIAFSLCRDEDSVWGPVKGVETINMTGVRDPNRKVTYEGLRRSTSNMFPAEILDRWINIDENLPVKYAKRYWRAVSEVCVEGWTEKPDSRVEVDPDTGEKREVAIDYRLKDLVGVAALAKLGKDIIVAHFESGEKDKLEQLVSRLVDVDWSKDPKNSWMKSQAGFAGQKDLYMLLHRYVFSGKDPEGNLAPWSKQDAVEVA